MKRRVYIASALLGLVAAVSAYALLRAHRDARRAGGQPLVAPVISVQVGALELKTLHRYVIGYGVVEPAPATSRRAAAEAQVAAPVNGVVTRVLIAAGERVRRGQLLAELNSDAMTETYAAAQARRERRLYAQHNASLKDLQQAEARLALLRITAPVSGTVVRVDIKPGTAVNTSTVLADVIDLHRLVVRTDIPAAQAIELKLGQPVQMLGGVRIATRLAYISPTVDQSDGAVSVWAALPADSRLRPGQYVRLRIVTATHRMTVAAPSAGVITDVGGHSVLSVVRGHEAIRVPVRIGIRESGWDEVSGPGLRAGAQIVTVGAYGLPPRVAIQITSDSARDPIAANAQGSETP